MASDYWFVKILFVGILLLVIRDYGGDARTTQLGDVVLSAKANDECDMRKDVLLVEDVASDHAYLQCRPAGRGVVGFWQWMPCSKGEKFYFSEQRCMTHPPQGHTSSKLNSKVTKTGEQAPRVTTEAPSTTSALTPSTTSTTIQATSAAAVVTTEAAGPVGAFVNQSCANGDQCMGGSVCDPAWLICKCPEGTSVSMNGGMMCESILAPVDTTSAMPAVDSGLDRNQRVKTVAPGGSCRTTGDQCGGGSFCSPDNGVCTCPEGFVDKAGACTMVKIEPVPPGEKCNSFAYCTGGAVCVRGVCTCEAPLVQMGNQCGMHTSPIPAKKHSGPGEPCDQGQACAGGSLCSTVTLLCACPIGTRDNGEKCVEVAEMPASLASVGQKCGVNSDCVVGAFCSASTHPPACQCLSTHVEVGKSCYRIVYPGQRGCDLSEQCASGFEGATCLNSVCMCPPGMSARGQTCQPDPTSPPATAPPPQTISVPPGQSCGQSDSTAAAAIFACTGGSACIRGVCSCPRGRIISGEKCVKKEARNSTHHRTAIFRAGTTPTIGFNRFPDESATTGSSIILATPGSSCSAGQQCTGGSVCRGGFCVCPDSDMIVHNGTCAFGAPKPAIPALAPIEQLLPVDPMAPVTTIRTTTPLIHKPPKQPKQPSSQSHTPAPSQSVLPRPFGPPYNVLGGGGMGNNEFSGYYLQPGMGSSAPILPGPMQPYQPPLGSNAHFMIPGAPGMYLPNGGPPPPQGAYPPVFVPEPTNAPLYPTDEMPPDNELGYQAFPLLPGLLPAGIRQDPNGGGAAAPPQQINARPKPPKGVYSDKPPRIPQAAALSAAARQNSILAPPGSACDEHVQCSGGSVCHRGECVCNEGYEIIGELCVHQQATIVSSASPSESCANGEMCSGGSLCDGRQCQCPGGTEARQGFCQAIPPKLSSPNGACSNGERCLGESTCNTRTGRCECPGNMLAVGARCLPLGRLVTTAPVTTDGETDEGVEVEENVEQTPVQQGQQQLQQQQQPQLIQISGQGQGQVIQQSQPLWTSIQPPQVVPVGQSQPQSHLHVIPMVPQPSQNQPQTASQNQPQQPSAQTTQYSQSQAQSSTNQQMTNQPMVIQQHTQPQQPQSAYQKTPWTQNGGGLSGVSRAPMPSLTNSQVKLVHFAGLSGPEGRCDGGQVCAGGSVCQSGVCKCPLGTSATNNNGICQATSTGYASLGEPCVEGSIYCNGPSVCLNGRCRCPPGTMQTGPTCVQISGSLLPLGAVCTHNDACMQRAQCKNGICTCQDGYKENNGSCTPATTRQFPKPGDLCAYGEQCRGNSRCLDGRCLCFPGFVVQNGTCLPVDEADQQLFSAPGDPCVTIEDCIGGSYCRLGFCVCPLGTESVNFQCATISNTGFAMAGQPCAKGERCTGRSNCVDLTCQCPADLINVNGVCEMPMSSNTIARTNQIVQPNYGPPQPPLILPTPPYSSTPPSYFIPQPLAPQNLPSSPIQPYELNPLVKTGLAPESRIPLNQLIPGLPPTNYTVPLSSLIHQGGNRFSLPLASVLAGQHAASDRDLKGVLEHLRTLKQGGQPIQVALNPQNIAAANQHSRPVWSQPIHIPGAVVADSMFVHRPVDNSMSSIVVGYNEQQQTPSAYQSYHIKSNKHMPMAPAPPGQKCEKGQSCSGGAVCSMGICQCPAGLKLDTYAGQCVADGQYVPPGSFCTNGQVCIGGSYCITGICLCPPGQDIIGYECRPLASLGPAAIASSKQRARRDRTKAATRTPKPDTERPPRPILPTTTKKPAIPTAKPNDPCQKGIVRCTGGTICYHDGHCRCQPPAILKNDTCRYPDQHHRPVNRTSLQLASRRSASCPDDPAQCQLPNCFCTRTGKEPPGDLRESQTPQFVVLTFDDAVNWPNLAAYHHLFEDDRFRNKNGCPLRGTFFVSHEGTDYNEVQRLYLDGHEMASNSISHVDLGSERQERWTAEIDGQRRIMAHLGQIDPVDIIGFRSPQLSLARDAPFEMMQTTQFLYDNSMSSNPGVDQAPYWPQTLDYSIPWECQNSQCPERSYPGLWSIPLNQFFNGPQLGGSAEERPIEDERQQRRPAGPEDQMPQAGPEVFGTQAGPARIRAHGSAATNLVQKAQKVDRMATSRTPKPSQRIREDSLNQEVPNHPEESRTQRPGGRPTKQGSRVPSTQMNRIDPADPRITREDPPIREEDPQAQRTMDPSTTSETAHPSTAETQTSRTPYPRTPDISKVPPSKTTSPKENPFVMRTRVPVTRVTQTPPTRKSTLGHSTTQATSRKTPEPTQTPITDSSKYQPTIRPRPRPPPRPVLRTTIIPDPILPTDTPSPAESPSARRLPRSSARTRSLESYIRGAMIRATLTEHEDESTIYRLLDQNFQRAYRTNKAPYILTLDADLPHYLPNNGSVRALERFLSEVAQKPDVWFVTLAQLLDWMRSPQPADRLLDFAPFSCSNVWEYRQKKTPPVCESPNRCLYRTTRLTKERHSLRTCAQCPDYYPWVDNIVV